KGLIADRQLRRVRSRQHAHPGRAAGPEDHPRKLLRVGDAEVPREAIVSADDIRQLVVLPSPSELVLFLFRLRLLGWLLLRGSPLGLDRFLPRLGRWSGGLWPAGCVRRVKARRSTQLARLRRLRLH